MPKNLTLVTRSVYSLINWYVGYLPFPKRGWKYFLPLLKRFDLDKRTYKKRISRGLRINVRPVDHIQKELFWYGHYELKTVSVLLQFIYPNSIFLDIGGNIGYYTVLVSAKASQGHVYTFEPVSFLRRGIEDNITLNRFDNVTVSDYAVSDTDRDSLVYISLEENTGMSGLLPAENFSGTTEKARTIRLDKWIEDKMVKQVDVIKIDVEGAELQALKGMQTTLTVLRPAVFVEVSNQQLAGYGTSASELYSFMKSLNYVAYLIDEKDTIRQVETNTEGYTSLFIHKEAKVPDTLKVICPL